MSLRIDAKDKVTIVVITYNRYAFLERLLSFYEKYAFPFPIIVLDSSTDKDISVRLNRLLSHNRVTHKKYPEDLFLAKKIAQGLLEVETAYCVLGADDDFLIPQGIEKCVAFLEGASDYAIAQGFFIHFTIRKDRLRRPKLFWGPLYEKQTSVVSDNPEDRIRFGWNCFNAPTFYSVFRTQLLRLVWTEAGNSTTNYNLMEILPFILGLMYSKVKILPTFFCARELNTYSWFDKAQYRKLYSPEACAPTIDCWASHLSQLQSIDYAKARKIIEDNLDLYLVRKFGGNLKGDRSPENKMVKGKNNFGSGFVGKVLRSLVWRWNKFCYWCVLKIRFEKDFDRVSQEIITADINPELLRRTRKSYSKLNGLGCFL